MANDAQRLPRWLSSMWWLTLPGVVLFQLDVAYGAAFGGAFLNVHGGAVDWAILAAVMLSLLMMGVWLILTTAHALIRRPTLLLHRSDWFKIGFTLTNAVLLISYSMYVRSLDR